MMFFFQLEAPYWTNLQQLTLITYFTQNSNSNNTNSGVGVIFGAVTKRLLFIGCQNKYCFVCSIASRKDEEPQPHMWFKNWSGASCAMEADIICEGFLLSESKHCFRYMNLWSGWRQLSISQYILTTVPYGKKVECANHVVKCYRTRL